MGRRNNHSNFIISHFYCCKCGKKGIDLIRKSGHYREAGHLKKLYCIYCGKEWNHAEIHSIYDDYSYEDFKLEMEYHNFDAEGNRKEPYRIFRGNLKQKGII